MDQITIDYIFLHVQTQKVMDGLSWNFRHLLDIDQFANPLIFFFLLFFSEIILDLLIRNVPTQKTTDGFVYPEYPDSKSYPWILMKFLCQKWANLHLITFPYISGSLSGNYSGLSELTKLWMKFPEIFGICLKWAKSNDLTRFVKLCVAALYV